MNSELDILLKESESSLLIRSEIVPKVLSAFSSLCSLKFFLISIDKQIIEQSPNSKLSPDLWNQIQARLEPTRTNGVRILLKETSRLCLEFPLYHRDTLLGTLILILSPLEASPVTLELLINPITTCVEMTMKCFECSELNDSSNARLTQYASEKKHLQARYETIAMENLAVRMEIEQANLMLAQDVKLTEQKFQKLFATSPFPQFLYNLNKVRDWLLQIRETQPNLSGYLEKFPEEASACLTRAKYIVANHTAQIYFKASSTSQLKSIALKLFPLQAQIQLLLLLNESLDHPNHEPIQLELFTINSEPRQALVQVGHLEHNWSLVSLYCLDITDRVEMEKGLIHAKMEAEIASSAKSQFLAVVSHELRTPLNGIIGFTSLLMETPVSEEQLTHLNYITLSSQRLNSLVTDILDFARLESNDFEVELQEFKLSNLLNEVISSRMSAATAKGLQILVYKSESIVDSMTSDPVMIHRMVDILLSNAIKFTPSGHIKIQYRCNHTPTGHRLIIEVEDTGIGIHKEHQATLFLPFSQSDSSITRSYDGLGIGLTICHRLASLLKGQITVESEINLGSKFCLEIPVTPKSTPQPKASEAHYRIAVAEDCPTNAAMLKETLGSFGVKADFFPNGTLLVQGSKIQAYDIILTDIYMPQMDGVEASKEIFNLNLKTGHNTYIIAVSASVTMSEKRRCQEAGIQDFISKPFRASDIRTAIEKAKQWLASKTNLTFIEN